MSRALRLGEVLGRVIHYLHEDFRALLTVIRVNHTWFGWGVVFLWRAPPWRALARVTGDRRQLYANCIYRLSLEDDDHFLLPQFEGLAFPHLQYLSIKTSKYLGPDGMAQLISSPAQELIPNLF